MPEKHYYFIENDPNPFPSPLTSEQQNEVDSIVREILSERPDFSLNLAAELIKDPRLNGFIEHHIVHSKQRISDAEN